MTEISNSAALAVRSRAPSREAKARRHSDWRYVPFIRSYLGVFLFFLYAPLLVLVVYSFNANTVTTVWDGFSLKWYGKVFENEAIRTSAWNSLVVAVATSILATTIATVTAFGMERGRLTRLREGLSAVALLPLLMPEIIIAVTTLAFFSLIGLRLGLGNLIVSHTVFCIPLALLPIRARLKDMSPVYEEAARDLYASEWEVFRHVTLPMISPAVAAGAVLSFVASIDDFIISLMVGPAGTTTLPVYIYGMVKRGVTPEINAVSTILLAVSLGCLLAIFLLLRRQRGQVS